MSEADFALRLVAWQRQHGRHDLPWQRTRDPYRVWLSEVMLQQTQVSTVRGYYARFLERFPTVNDLAAAPLDEVLALWAGLGYYSRARNLHACAQAVSARGGFPCDARALAELPGIGPSTARAIAAFCFGERLSIFDGNVQRVLARLLAFDQDLSGARAVKVLWTRADALVPAQAEAMPAYTQGLMDLGATVCTPRSPNCAACPVQSLCAAHAQGRVGALPRKTKTLKRRQRESWWLWLHREADGALWLQQRPARGIWAGLWTLPLFDDEAALRAAAGAAALEALPQIQHALTHLDWLLHPRRAVWNRAAAPLPEGRWVQPADWPAHGMPAPLQKLLGWVHAGP
ncbi:MAG: A/G-specific adenine glycosylase [Inhella sp.]|jgi:A/G-specific adenine glycosylase|uniref:A/G-specific adenine glycosylase n=1 Tax=Inhella sp. TaxID=1921806 RepID=UPI0022C9C627|nr:A/G-specific adenine glycosylase [Inhella sp.]MCZ8233631.1 A/G-specific adenine glycosylase [Inhella sp.]